MKVIVVAVGKLKERFWIDACNEYLKRLAGYANVEVREVSDRDPARSGGQTRATGREGADILKAVPPRSYCILLAIGGTRRSSEQLARHFEDLSLYGKGNLCFVIGGSNGVSSEVKARADEQLSFGPITLPHNLARVVLLEQLYRCFRISRDEPYHK